MQIFEATGRYGGKTHTVTLDQPKPPVMPPGLPQKTACELGTCYLSPAYDDVAVALKDFMQGNIRTGFFLTADHNDPPDHSFRGMVTDAQFDGVPVTEKVMDYDDYVLKRGFYEANKPFADPANWLKDFDAETVAKEILLALAEYELLLTLYMGFDALPMPRTPTTELIDAGYGSFYDMRARNDLLILTGLLEYAYSVQGYGPLRRIPAYFGMIWISTPLVLAIGLTGLKVMKEATVTVLLNGWLDVWNQMRPTLDITLNARVLRIDRSV